MNDTRPVQEVRELGLALGLAVGPAGGFAQIWSGLGDPAWYVPVLMSAVAGLIGAATLPLFRREDGPEEWTRNFGFGFFGLYGLCLALVAGTIAAFPVGASLGSVGGLVAGLVTAFIWRLVHARGAFMRVTATTLGAGGAAFLVLFLWTR